MGQQHSADTWYIRYHFVWCPMRAKACLSGEIARRLEELIRERAEQQEFAPVSLVILPDRVYLAATAPPTLAPHSIVCQVKAYTSRVLRHEFPELTRIPSLWTRAYLVMAGDGLDPQEVIQHFEQLRPERRPRGRPRKVQPSTDGDDDSPPRII